MISFTAVTFINSILFAIAFGLNEENSGNLLAGYNNMSDEERKKFDTKNYLKFLRKFLIFISVKSTIIFGLIFYFIDNRSAGISYTSFLLTALIWGIFQSKKYMG
tara:strand:+ start:4048 stop:4362 length:315 start_codon:yes stop_codon:yes gene_type:complete